MKIDIDFTPEELKLIKWSLKYYYHQYDTVNRSHLMWDVKKKIKKTVGKYSSWYDMTIGEDEVTDEYWNDIFTS